MHTDTTWLRKSVNTSSIKNGGDYNIPKHNDTYFYLLPKSSECSGALQSAPNTSSLLNTSSIATVPVNRHLSSSLLSPPFPSGHRSHPSVSPSHLSPISFLSSSPAKKY